MWFDSTLAGSDDASPWSGDDCLLRQKQNRVEFFPIIVWTGVGRGDERGHHCCGSIPYTLDQVMLLNRWEKTASSV